MRSRVSSQERSCSVYHRYPHGAPLLVLWIGSHRRPPTGAGAGRRTENASTLMRPWLRLCWHGKGICGIVGAYTLPIDERHCPIERIARLYHSHAAPFAEQQAPPWLSWHRCVGRWPGGVHYSIAICGIMAKVILLPSIRRGPGLCAHGLLCFRISGATSAPTSCWSA